MRVDNHRGTLGTRRVLNCGHCGQSLPRLSYFPQLASDPAAGRAVSSSLSPDHYYIDWREMAGWTFDGETLRPTDDHHAKRQRAREKVHATPRSETKRTRQKLAGRVGLLPHEERQRQGGLVGFPSKRPAPRWIECSRCHVENQVAAELTAQNAVG
jgi:hypothetical protein